MFYRGNVKLNINDISAEIHNEGTPYLFNLLIDELKKQVKIFQIIGISNGTEVILTDSIKIEKEIKKSFDEEMPILIFNEEIHGTSLISTNNNIEEVWIKLFNENNEYLMKCRASENMEEYFKKGASRLVNIIIKWVAKISNTTYDGPPPDVIGIWDFGETSKAKLYANGVMIVSGTGQGTNFTDIGGNDVAPWLQEEHGDEIIKLIINNGITRVGAYAFRNCENIQEVNFSDSITVINFAAFWGCKNFSKIIIPNNITTISTSSFRECGVSAFTESAIETEIIIPNGTTAINGNSFKDCWGLKTITLPDTVTKIGSTAQAGAFQNCTNLENIELPDGITIIGGNTFYNCGNLNLEYLPNELKTIEKGAFYNCEKITISEIPEGVTAIKEIAFYGCDNITTISFLGTPDSIETNAFQNCENLTNIYVPWAEDEVANAPWGATNAEIHYSESN